MFVRTVSMHLKVNAHKGFSDVFHNQIIPILRNQRGFQDAMLWVVPGGPEVVAISIWDSREAADLYNQKTFPEVQQLLSRVIERSPEIKVFNLAFSTLHDISAEVATAYENQSPILTSDPGVGG